LASKPALRPRDKKAVYPTIPPAQGWPHTDMYRLYEPGYLNGAYCLCKYNFIQTGSTRAPHPIEIKRLSKRYGGGCADARKFIFSL